MLLGSNLSVIEGKDGWLFLKASGPDRYMENAADLTKWRRTHLPGFVANYLARHKRMVERGIPFIVVIAPEGSGIYPENLPDDIKVERPTAGEILADKLREAGVDVICPSAELRAAKGPVDLCCRLDSHWSYSGAYLCYRKIVQAAEKYIPVRCLAWQEIVYGAVMGYGDLGVHVVPERRGMLQTVTIPGYDVAGAPNVFDIRDKNVRRFTNPRGTGKALIFRDSFANALSPFFERTFAQTVMVAPSPSALDSAVDSERPDIVILEVAERRLFEQESAFADWTARTFEQEYYELASNPTGGRLQVDAAALIEAGRPAEAIPLAATAIALEGAEARVHNLAWALHAMGQHQLCRRLIDGMPTSKLDKFLHYLNAEAHSAMGDRLGAIACIEQALAIQPRNALYLFLRGEWLYLLGKFQEAREAFALSSQYAPLHERTWSRLYDTSLALGENQVAIGYRREAKRLFCDT